MSVVNDGMQLFDMCAKPAQVSLTKVSQPVQALRQPPVVVGSAFVAVN